jgi:hypothetical protein
MSALGQKQTFWPFIAMSALPPKADIAEHHRHVCFVPKADVTYSITSSANEIRPGGIVSPRALAVLRLITNSKFVG